ncbi:MAG: epoxyqueuosine reductase [Peptococcaceae bacterium]|jgi:epoxyqueuosine reductase QueG|nr:epoxyqueuosine reductase [Peptococcaceae bacterium]
MKNTEDLVRQLSGFLEDSPLNRARINDADVTFYADPVCAVAGAGDPFFERLREPEIVNPGFRLPGEWLPDARSVISIFYPLTESVRVSNYAPGHPSSEWLYARIEGGDRCIPDSLTYLVDEFAKEGVRAVVPSMDPAFKVFPGFTSNWSERHVAFIAGLGTFGLSKSFITFKGVAGRFGSIITDRAWPVTPRSYTDAYEYCNQCQACLHRCPSGAITPEGKDKSVCGAYLGTTREIYAPRYGCGKCQTKVPCEAGVPPRRKGTGLDSGTDPE